MKPEELLQVSKAWHETQRRMQSKTGAQRFAKEEQMETEEERKAERHVHFLEEKMNVGDGVGGDAQPVDLPPNSSLDVSEVLGGSAQVSGGSERD